jgi:hypothetical protein
LIRTIYDKAMDGDMNAAKLLVERLCGKLGPDTVYNVTNQGQGNMTIRIQMEEDEPEQQDEPKGPFAKPDYPTAGGATGAGF